MEDSHRFIVISDLHWFLNKPLHICFWHYNTLGVEYLENFSLKKKKNYKIMLVVSVITVSVITVVISVISVVM